MTTLQEAKLVFTRRADVDAYLTTVFVLFTGSIVLHVVYTLWKAYHDCCIRVRERRRDDSIWRLNTCLFLVSAAVAFLIVNSFKFSYRQVQTVAQKEVQDLVDGIQTLIPADWYSKARSDHEGRPNAYIWAGETGKDFWHRPNVYLDELSEELKQTASSMKDRMKRYDPTVDHTTYEIVEAAKELLGRVHLWRQGDNAWDNLKILVATYSRFWWTQQWFMGYITWAIFVAIKSWHRAIGPSVAFSFIILGYIFGLAGAQCLFYALMHVTWPASRAHTWAPDPMRVVLPFAGLAYLVSGLPNILISSLKNHTN